MCCGIGRRVGRGSLVLDIAQTLKGWMIASGRCEQDAFAVEILCSGGVFVRHLAKLLLYQITLISKLL
jgi:hypothetical protein